ncbi:ATP-binding protein [Pseudonocardia acaciae]|uniref:ATP-binding protein n=1 Tax=Pseudonocardia acaciae TaxID=551276 RepID=UPI0024811573|nr:tetratricopeptide repeat protein [Pseudonocardia acaciae]
MDRVLAQGEVDVNAVAVSVIAGTAGVGKTSLAIHWAHRVRERFPDGQLYVNLRGYDPGMPVTADHALDHFLRALDVPAGRIPNDVHAKAALYRSLVADRRMLIILDNAATVGQVRPLLPGTAGCHVLVTSRRHLPSLVVREGAHRMGVDMLSDDESVTLLRTVTADYRGQDDLAELAELARLCARLPLALRIAAERAASRPRMPLRELIRDLRDESLLWDALSSEDDEEADAVRTVFAWSYRALPPDTARMFRLLGLHPGAEFSLEAAAALAAVPVEEARHLLDALIGANLLEYVGSGRYQFHDLMRAYASDQAHREEPADEQRVVLRRVLDWYLHSASAARRAIAPERYSLRIDLEPAGRGVPVAAFDEQSQATRWYETERANLMAAAHAAATAGFDRVAWRIPAVLAEVNGNRDPLSGWLEVERIALAAARRCGDKLGEALIHQNLGVKFRLSHRTSEAVGSYRSAEELFGELGDQLGLVLSMNGVGLTFLLERNYDEARVYFERALDIARELDNKYLVAILFTNLGDSLRRVGHPQQAEGHLQRAVAMLHDLGDELEESFAGHWLAVTQIELGQVAAARETLQRVLAVARDHDNPIAESFGLLHLGMLELVEGAPEDALVSSQRATVMFRQIGYRGREAEALVVTGEAYERLGRLDEAVGFYRRAAAIQREVGDRWYLPVALDKLASALELMERPDQARQVWREALPLLADIAGPRAEGLRERIERRLSG